jgi:tartrate dehydratase beta subunit/fumarate hydratase class I family protein
MPLSEELYTCRDRLSPPATINGVERKEELPVTLESGYYFFSGEIPNQEQRCCPNHTIAIYAPGTRRLYIYTVSY